MKIKIFISRIVAFYSQTFKVQLSLWHYNKVLKQFALWPYRNCDYILCFATVWATELDVCQTSKLRILIQMLNVMGSADIKL